MTSKPLPRCLGTWRPKTRVEQTRRTTVDYTTCECGKRGYPSRTCARRAHRTSGERLRFYRCGVSDTWHATNDEKNSRADSEPRKHYRASKRLPSRRWRAACADPHRETA